MANKTKKVDKKEMGIEEVRSAVFSQIDSRLFGACITGRDLKGIGAIQIMPAFSMHPITVEDYQITTAFKSKEEDTNTTMGVKKIVPYGLYSTTAIYSSPRGKQNMVTAEDLFDFDDAMVNFPVLRTGIKSYVQPALYLRVIRSKYGNIKGYSNYIDVECENAPLNKTELKIDAQRLVDKLKSDTDIVEIRGFISDNMIDDFKTIQEELDIKEIEDWKENDHEYISEYVMVYEVIMSNANGDPRNDNMPRTIGDSDTGMITDVRIKRWVRDYFEAVLGKSIFVSRTSELSTAEGRMVKLSEQETEV